MEMQCKANLFFSSICFCHLSAQAYLHHLCPQMYDNEICLVAHKHACFTNARLCSFGNFLQSCADAGSVQRLSPRTSGSNNRSAHLLTLCLIFPAASTYGQGISLQVLFAYEKLEDLWSNRRSVFEGSSSQRDYANRIVYRGDEVPVPYVGIHREYGRQEQYVDDEDVNLRVQATLEQHVRRQRGFLHQPRDEIFEQKNMFVQLRYVNARACA